tara:strand:+ start:3 stop:1274 length:1272 start_codon:yes stop_codon:yes gene_type:complete
MKRIWSDENKFKTWLKVEIAATEVLNSHGLVPDESLQIIKQKADFDKDRVLEIEKTTRHDVIAFLTNVAEYVGPDSRYIHMGMTSSDLLDTSLALLCKESGEIILNKLSAFHLLLRKKAVEYKDTFQIGRSHGVHAEPITFGLKMALWSDEVNRHIGRLQEAIKSVSIGKISGAVGTFQHLDPKVEEQVCQNLGISAANVSNQVVQRDGHAHFLQTLALIGATIEKISIEIRHLQRTEVLEAEECFQKGQKGSSAMPHKKNPIVTERMTGFARLLRSNSHVAVENIALWHERDISHSSVERIIIPDSTTLMDYMLIRMRDLIDNLIVYPDKMMENINSTNGLIFSQEVLLALIKKGITREESYSLVQRNAMKSWDEKSNFLNNLKNDSEVMGLIDESELEKLFDLDKVLININKIFERLKLNE